MAKGAPTPASFKPGQSGNPNGRPKKGESITELAKEFLEHIPDGHKKTHKQLFFEKVYAKAMLQDDIAAQKLIWNYVDGMPKQSSEVSGPGGGPIPVVPILGDRHVYRNDSDQENP